MSKTVPGDSTSDFEPHMTCITFVWTHFNSNGCRAAALWHVFRSLLVAQDLQTSLRQTCMQKAFYPSNQQRLFRSPTAHLKTNKAKKADHKMGVKPEKSQNERRRRSEAKSRMPQLGVRLGALGCLETCALA